MDEQKRVFAENLNRMLTIKHKTQAQVADDLGISRAAMNMWCQGVTFPRMPKIQKLARYFHCQVSDLVDPRPITPDILVQNEDSEFIIEMKSIEEEMDDEALNHLLSYARWYRATKKKGGDS